MSLPVIHKNITATGSKKRKTNDLGRTDNKSKIVFVCGWGECGACTHARVLKGSGCSMFVKCSHEITIHSCKC